MTEKQKIADVIEKVLIEINHPEMPTEKPYFILHVEGKEPWSWADIQPNWTFTKEKPPTTTGWNEHAREILRKTT